MTPADFIRKWGDSRLRERQGAQEHFIDLCRLIGEPTPAEDDPLGERCCFERGAEKVGGGDGWADVWRRGCFGWEYKGKHKDLNAALRQLQAYALDLQNPPYLVVCDMDRIVVHTNWTNTISKRFEWGLDDLRIPSRLDILRQVFQGSESLKPGISPQELTAKVAARFGDLGTYHGKVPQEADFVCYWVAKAWGLVGKPGEGPQFSTGKKAGLVTTNSIRAGANRRVLEPIAAGAALREAWPDEPWVLEGAAVRVSMIGFGWGFSQQRINGIEVQQINADLTGAGVDLTKARRLAENAGVAFMGDTKGGEFDISGEIARTWLKLPLNPNGRSNSDVLRPWRNAMDLTRRPADKWIIDFGWTMSEAEAALYEAPFRHLAFNVKPDRANNNRETYRRNWWRHVEPRPKLRNKLIGRHRILVTPRVARHRIFLWLESKIIPDSRIFAFVRSGNLIFGILQSAIHEVWSILTVSWHGVGNDPTYNTES